MSKNFETEYKKYADSTVPDLWSRIEAGVDAYEESIKSNGAGSDEVKKGKIVNIEDYNRDNKGINSESQEVKDKPVRKRINIKPYMGALAACACLFLVIVVMKNVISSSNSAATAESSAPAAAPAMEAASDSAGEYEAESEETYDEAVAEAAEEYTDNYADDAAVYEEEAPAMAEEAAPAMEYEEAAEASEPDLSVYAAGDSDKTVTNDTQAFTSNKEKKDSSNRDVVKEITVYAVPDMKTLNDDEGSLEIKITDPLDSDLKKDEIISVYLSKDKNGKYINDGMDIKTIDGSESRMFKVTLTLSDDGKYTLLSIE